MAITRAQQYRQMLKKGSKKPVEQAGVMNYMPSKMVTVPKIAKSSPDTPTAKLAYITPEEQNILIDLNLYGSLDGKPNRGPGGIPSLEGDFGPGGTGAYSEEGTGRDVSVDKEGRTVIGGDIDRGVDVRKARSEAAAKAAAKEKRKTIRQRLDDYNLKQRQKYINRILKQRQKKISAGLFDVEDMPGVDLMETEDYFGFAPSIKDYGPEGTGKYSQQFIDDVLSGKRQSPEFFSEIDLGTVPGFVTKGLAAGANFLGKKMSGPVTRQELERLNKEKKSIMNIDPSETTINEMMETYEPNRFKLLNPPTGGDGPQDPCRGPNPPAYCFTGIRSSAPVVEEEPEYVNPLFLLSPRIAGTQFAAEGGRIGLKSGSVLESLGFTPEHSAAVDAMDKNFTGSQFDYAAASTKDMVDRASNPLTAVASAVGNVVGRPAYDFVDAAQKYSDKGYQGEFSLSPQGAKDFFGNLGLLGKEFLDQKPGVMMAGALKGGIQSLGTKLGEGIYDKFNTSAKADDENFDMKAMLAKEAQAKKQKQQAKNFKKIKEAQLAKEAAAAMEAAQRQATTSMAEQNRQRGRGGYQSDFAQDKGFMGGSGTAAEMGSFAGGGIASLEDMDREGFLLGGIAKGLKKAVRGVKKLAKSPIGKAALGFAAFQYGKGLGIMDKFNDLTKLQKFGVGISVPSILAGLMTPKEDEDKFDIDSYYASSQLDPSQSIRGMGSEFDFYGGQRIASAEGGATEKKEPVAKKVMPLIDMDGKEKDYRETGGFVDMGRMEKADDVPARLSKNEFVFTADAVRNAGDGSIDKGSEVMYNMMKNLESGGDVSEESQGLDGARKMFQTSQRLEEVL